MQGNEPDLPSHDRRRIELAALCTAVDCGIAPQSNANIETQEEPMLRSKRNIHLATPPLPRLLPIAVVVAASVLLPISAHAASPWENAVNVLQASFTGPIARGLSLVSIVWGGLMFAFAEGDSKRMLAGILFGVGMAIGAVNFMLWLFP
jgi:type IV secretory pathway VirB2 component (pilin)